MRKIILNSSKNIDDVAWVYKGQSLLKDYSSIPWRHYKNFGNKAVLMKSNLELTIHNINIDANNIRNVTVKDSVFDENFNYLFSSSIGGANNYNPDTYTPYAYPLNGFTYPTSVQINDEGTNFYSLAKLTTNPDLNSENNTVVYKQRLYNYYAFDDGTAEAGLSMLSPFSSCAVRFNFLEGDTLRGIRVFWAQMGDYVGNNNLQLVVWQNIFIDSILYEQVGLTPDYVDSINGFAIYHATNPVYIPAGICYVGCIFTSANYYNLGVDRNTNNSNNNYYNFAGQWIQDPEPVALMIRPVVGDSVIYASTAESMEASLTVFPNPASDFISIASPLQNIASVEIYNSQGNVVFNQAGNSTTIMLPSIANGLYIVRVTTQQGLLIHKRIIIEK
ncbi:MAG: T9SS type A sorting domain-containing protein [Bacteroidetes bacterium]|nr:T9SS type A sorting domain-containing protein [Bacteroidota bacterium]